MCLKFWTSKLLSIRCWSALYGFIVYFLQEGGGGYSTKQNFSTRATFQKRVHVLTASIQRKSFYFDNQKCIDVLLFDDGDVTQTVKYCSESFFTQDWTFYPNFHSDLKL